MQNQDNPATTLDRNVADQLIGTVIAGRYKVSSLLGIGSMGGWFNIKNTAISLVRDEIAPAWVGTTTAERINWIPHLAVEHYTD